MKKILMLITLVAAMATMSSCRETIKDYDKSLFYIDIMNFAWYNVDVMATSIVEDNNHKLKEETLYFSSDIENKFYRYYVGSIPVSQGVLLSEKNDKVVEVTFADLDTVSMYGWEKVLSEKKYLQMCVIYKDKITEINGNVSFPPTWYMRSLELDPPFGTYSTWIPEGY